MTRSYFPFYIVIISFFIPVVNHIFRAELSTYLLIFSLIFLFLIIGKSILIPKDVFFFALIWLFILLTHLIFKNNFAVFGYMQSFYYFLIFYIMFKENRERLEIKKIIIFLKIIYAIIFFSLLFEWIINLFHLEGILFNLFSGNNVTGVKNYQYLSSRLVNAISGLEYHSLNSIFFGAQSGSILSLLCVLFYNIFDESKILGKRNYFVFSIVFLIFSYTMTATAITLFIFCYFVFVSRSSTLNNKYLKFILATAILFFTGIIVETLFSVLFMGDNLNFYIFVFLQPLFDLSNLTFQKLVLGIDVYESIHDYTVSFELGMVQSVYLVGFLPLLFWFTLLAYATLRRHKYHNKGIRSLDQKRVDFVVRNSYLVFLVSFISTFHYLSIYSTGYFQLLGLHLALFFLFSQKDKLNCNLERGGN